MRLETAGRRCRWFLVIGRARGTCLEIGRYLAAGPGAAIARARRERGELLAGLTLKAEVLR